MEKNKIYESLIYLDKEYISAKYEEISGIDPITSITKTEGLNAGLKIPLLSAGASSIESKTYTISTNSMLANIIDELNLIGKFDLQKHAIGQKSKIAWVEGTLSVAKVTSSKTKKTETIIGKPKESDGITTEKLAEERFFKIGGEDNLELALITSPDYFSSGIDSFQSLLGTVVHQVNIPVKALVRVFSSKSAFDEWIACPLVIIEKS
ncbi:hypothetical protein ID144_08680 [Pseudomonas sp. JM0905a]|uniref:hypothetical protein n=1 Tax=Pseudomonas sp. JM0905a TaxID=2772484 RepID=UPI001686BFC3|nr:hypothetical protein [Pseudomonas sp. JM0905a]MBD2837109.1 hypothetical protein [Pseudomonas sp. JM0905a]